MCIRDSLRGLLLDEAILDEVVNLLDQGLEHDARVHGKEVAALDGHLRDGKRTPTVEEQLRAHWESFSLWRCKTVTYMYHTHSRPPDQEETASLWHMNGRAMERI